MNDVIDHGTFKFLGQYDQPMALEGLATGMEHWRCQRHGRLCRCSCKIIIQIQYVANYLLKILTE